MQNFRTKGDPKWLPKNRGTNVFNLLHGYINSGQLKKTHHTDACQK